MLTKIQEQAIKANNNRIIVWAGPGTGKTTVLTLRIADLIINKKISPHNLLALTFTNKASFEMRERLERFENQQLKKTINAFTFHSYFYKFICENLALFGFIRPPSIYDENDVNDVIDLMIHDSLYNVKRLDILKTLYKKYCQQNQMFSEDQLKWISVFEDRMLKRYNAISYDMILWLAYYKTTTNKTLQLNFRNRFKHVLIDEFQDTDLIQAKLIQVLNPDNLFLVGDANQCIYSWRGSRFDFLLNYIKDPSFKVFILDKTFRLPKDISQCSYNLIRHNGPEGVYQDLKTDKGGGEINLFHGSLQEALNFTLRKVEKKKDVAILTRTNILARIIYDYLITNKIYAILLTTEKEMWEEPIIRSILAYFKIANNPFDFISLRQAMKLPQRGLMSIPSIIQNVRLNALKNNRTVLDQFILDNPNDPISIFISLIEKDGVKETNLLLMFLLYDLHLITPYLHLPNKLKLINRLHEKVILWEDKTSKTEYSEFLKWIAFRDMQDKLIEEKAEIKVMTMHGSKGLEFEEIIIFGANEGISPDHRSELQEERRLFYVAMTRAKERISIVGFTELNNIYTNKTIKLNESRFLTELYHAEETKNESKTESLTNSN